MPSKKPKQPKQPAKPTDAQPKKPLDKPHLAYLLLSAVLFLVISSGAVYYLATSPSVVINPSSVTLHDGENLISTAGTYTLSGSIQGFVHIATPASAEVHLILDNVSIENPSGPAIYIEKKSSTLIELVGENTLSAAPTDDLDAALYAKGDLLLSGEGSLSIVSSLDGIAGKSTLEISSGTYHIQSTAKGLKAKDLLSISGGILDIASEDDAIHSNGDLTISGGDFQINAGDDGIHADGTLEITDGKIDIAQSSEGLEAHIINLRGGDLSIVAKDDGINATNSDGSNQVFRAGDAELNLLGAKVLVTANGDGLDSNGKITMTAGEVYVNGPTSSADSAVDCDGEISFSGGTLIAVGSSGMAQNATSAKQPSILIGLNSSQSGDLILGSLQFSPSRSYTAILISSPALALNKKYDLKIKGSTIQSFTLTENITTIGNLGGFGSGNGFGGGFNGNFSGDKRPNGDGSSSGGSNGGGKRPSDFNPDDFNPSDFDPSNFDPSNFGPSDFDPSKAPSSRPSDR